MLQDTNPTSHFANILLHINHMLQVDNFMSHYANILLHINHMLQVDNFMSHVANIWLHITNIMLHNINILAWEPSAAKVTKSYSYCKLGFTGKPNFRH